MAPIPRGVRIEPIAKPLTGEPKCTTAAVHVRRLKPCFSASKCASKAKTEAFFALYSHLINRLPWSDPVNARKRTSAFELHTWAAASDLEMLDLSDWFHWYRRDFLRPMKRVMEAGVTSTSALFGQLYQQLTERPNDGTPPHTPPHLLLGLGTEPMCGVSAGPHARRLTRPCSPPQRPGRDGADRAPDGGTLPAPGFAIAPIMLGDAIDNITRPRQPASAPVPPAGRSRSASTPRSRF